MERVKIEMVKIYVGFLNNSHNNVCIIQLI